MKKIVALLVAAGLIAWPAATWFYGGRAQSNAEQMSAAITQSIPYISVVSSDYNKGFLNSTQTIRLRPAFPGFANEKLPELVIENKIEHGPFPGFSGVGAARITHNVVWPPEVKAQLTKLWGQAEPLAIVTQMGLGGGGSTTFKSPPATGKFDDVNVAFQGLDGVMNFNSGFQKIDYNIALPGASLDDANSKAVLGRIASSGAHTKLAGTEKLYIGKQQMSMAGLDVSTKGQPAANVKQIDYVVETTSPEANFVNATGKLTGASLRFGATDMGTLDYSYSMSKLHAPTVEALTKSIQVEMEKLGKAVASKDATKGTSAAADPNAAMLNALKLHLPELSKHVPKFNIDKMRIGTATHYAQLDAAMFLKPVAAAELDNPMSIIPKIDASMNIELSDSILAMLAGQAGERMAGQTDPAMLAQLPPEARVQAEAQMKDQAKAMVDQQIDAMVQQGYVIRGVGKVSSQIALKEGKLTVNGKQVGQGLLPTK
jgi:uncharacterized protein YdgA (DUF945 family)